MVREVMTKELTINDEHFNKINDKVAALRNKANSQGLLNSGPLFYDLNELLLDGVRDFTEKENSREMNNIRSKKYTAEIAPQEFVTRIMENTNIIISHHEKILNNEVSCSYGMPQANAQSILDTLNFTDKAEHTVREMCSGFEASYSEYLENKSNEQVMPDNSNKALKKSAEANRIAKISLWVTGAISLGALIVSVISSGYFK
jgi:hypothetical protein